MMIRITIPGRPITKKNSMMPVQNRGKTILLPSKQFRDYQERAGYFIRQKHRKISVPVNVACRYYMPTHQRVDLLNLLSATLDILVHYGVLADDNSSIVVSHDGSRVLYDKDNPRVEIVIAEVHDE